jgi:hypothetical protein
MKVETHNHPTAISPYPGRATGSGGEIRDEGATGRGAKPKAGLTGFTVSHLRVPGFVQPWEATTAARPHRLAARHHARGPHRRRGVQQRVRPPEPAATSAPSSTGPMPTAGPRARLPQADHDRRRLGNIRRMHVQKAVSPGAAHRARRPGDADRPRRRRRVVMVSGASTRSWTSPRCSATTRDAAALPGGHRPPAGAGRRQSHPAHPRRRCRRPVERAAGSW